jgi:DNA-binding FadR family transcriptional regulator
VTRKYEQLTKDLLHEILDGEYQPGEQLPSEVRLSEARGVSRGVVREAIEALRKLGFVDVTHGRGQWVRADEHWELLDSGVLAVILSAQRLDLLREIVDCQAMLEPAVAALAAERASDTAIAELAEAHAAVVRVAARRRRTVADEDALVLAEIQFHRTLARMTGNRPVERMLAPVVRALALVRHELAAGQDEALVRSLRRSLRAIEARDPEAARKSVEARVAAARRWLKRVG